MSNTREGRTGKILTDLNHLIISQLYSKMCDIKNSSTRIIFQILNVFHEA